MKKKLALALAASFALTTGSAFAAESSDLKVDGNVTVQYRVDQKPTAHTTVSGLKETLTLNATQKVTDNVDLYARFNYQRFDNGLESMQDYINGGNGSIDAFGLKIAQGGWNWTIGSQALTIGAQGLVYDNGFIGQHSLPYAVKGNGKLGVVDTSVYYARTNYQKALGDQEKFYGTNLSYAVDSKNTVGAFYSRWSPDVAYWTAKFGGTVSSNYNAYGLDYSHKFDNKLSFVAEYAKTSMDSDNQAYIAGLTYAATPADKVTAKYYRSEAGSQIYDKNWWGVGTTPNPDTKGYILSYNHTIDKASSVAVGYDSEKVILGGTGPVDRNRTTVTYNFNF